MAAGKVFLSYRRDDSAGYARLLYDRLNARFPDRIFMDISAIELGADFVEAIEKAVSSCDVLIALIGKQWLSGADPGGRRRLDDPADFVHLEISSALKRNVRVVPALLRGATMPVPEQLPADLAPLARRQALEISDADFDHDVDRLIRVLERELGETEPRKPGTRLRWLGATAAALCIIAVVAVSVFRRTRESPTGPSSTPTSSTAPAGGEKTSSMEDAINQLGRALPGFAQPAAQPAAGSGKKILFDAVGKWLVAAQTPVSGTMLLNLKADHTFEISKTSGALSGLAAVLGSSGTWTFDGNSGRLVLLPSAGGMALGIQIIAKQNQSFSASDPSGVTYLFTRQ